jgi:hypothetical protein
VARREAQSVTVSHPKMRGRLAARHTRSSSEAIAHQKMRQSNEHKRMLICGRLVSAGPRFSVAAGYIALK